MRKSSEFLSHKAGLPERDGKGRDGKWAGPASLRGAFEQKQDTYSCHNVLVGAHKMIC